MEQDRILFKIGLPWPLPDLAMAVIKCGNRQRWTLFIRLVTGESTDGTYYYYHYWWLQVRAWYPPVYIFRGWLRAG